MATAVIISTEAMATDGYRVGSYLVKPETFFSGVYDNNIFATGENEVEIIFA